MHRGKMEQILLAYGLPKETVAALMMLSKNTKVKIRSPDANTDYFDIVAGVLQGDTLAPYLFIIYLDYVLRRSLDLLNENSINHVVKILDIGWCVLLYPPYLTNLALRDFYLFLSYHNAVNVKKKLRKFRWVCLCKTFTARNQVSFTWERINKLPDKWRDNSK